MKNTVIFDIDGTLANGDHRLHLIRGKPKNWGEYFRRLDKDAVHEHVREMYLGLRDYYNLYIVSGRPEDYRKATEEWLERNGITGYINLYMRPSKDNRNDDIIKEEILNKHFDKEKVLCVFDDRPRVIRMWRRNGIPVFNCGDGEEF